MGQKKREWKQVGGERIVGFWDREAGSEFVGRLLKRVDSGDNVFFILEITEGSVVVRTKDGKMEHAGRGDSIGVSSSATVENALSQIPARAEVKMVSEGKKKVESGKWAGADFWDVKVYVDESIPF